MIPNTRPDSGGTRPICTRPGLFLTPFILSFTALLGVGTTDLLARQTSPVQTQRVDPETSTKDLLPVPPRAEKTQPVTGDDLTQIPEVELQAPLAKGTNVHWELERLQKKIDDLNRKHTAGDGFLKTLLAERHDLAGLPFAMGDACRTKGERNRQFTIAVQTVRNAAERANGIPKGPQKAETKDLSSAAMRIKAASFWEQYRVLCREQDRWRDADDKDLCQYVIPCASPP